MARRFPYVKFWNWKLGIVVLKFRLDRPTILLQRHISSLIEREQQILCGSYQDFSLSTMRLNLIALFSLTSTILADVSTLRTLF